MHTPSLLSSIISLLISTHERSLWSNILLSVPVFGAISSNVFCMFSMSSISSKSWRAHPLISFIIIITIIIIIIIVTIIIIIQVLEYSPCATHLCRCPVPISTLPSALPAVSPRESQCSGNFWPSFKNVHKMKSSPSILSFFLPTIFLYLLLSFLWQNSHLWTMSSDPSQPPVLSYNSI